VPSQRGQGMHKSPGQGFPPQAPSWSPPCSRCGPARPVPAWRQREYLRFRHAGVGAEIHAAAGAIGVLLDARQDVAGGTANPDPRPLS
jgi:hypothetical protein